jgi:hypothetical protein
VYRLPSFRPAPGSPLESQPRAPVPASSPPFRVTASPVPAGWTALPTFVCPVTARPTARPSARKPADSPSSTTRRRRSPHLRPTAILNGNHADRRRRHHGLLSTCLLPSTSRYIAHPRSPAPTGRPLGGLPTHRACKAIPVPRRHRHKPRSRPLRRLSHIIPNYRSRPKWTSRSMPGPSTRFGR